MFPMFPNVPNVFLPPKVSITPRIPFPFHLFIIYGQLSILTLTSYAYEQNERMRSAHLLPKMASHA
jgi:hypothetical protein